MPSSEQEHCTAPRLLDPLRTSRTLSRHHLSHTVCLSLRVVVFVCVCVCVCPVWCSEEWGVVSRRQTEGLPCCLTWLLSRSAKRKKEMLAFMTSVGSMTQPGGAFENKPKNQGKSRLNIVSRETEMSSEGFVNQKNSRRLGAWTSAKSKWSLSWG